jgi:hypothetical protein
MHRNLLPLLLAIGIVGCQPHSDPNGSAKSDPQNPKPANTVNLVPSMMADRSDLTSLPSEGDIIVQLDIYELILSHGRISRNDEFWRRVDEDHVDLANHDLMLRNGIRYGIGNTEDWPYFKQMIEEFCPKSKRGSTPPQPSGFVPMTMRAGVEAEDIWYVAESGLTGRTFHHCDNILNFSYEAVPHRAGDTRIKVGAMVQDLQQQIDVTVLNQSRQVDIVRPFQLYDLKLEAIVPNEHFLIIAPSELTKIHSSLGSVFLLRPENAEEMEVALIVVPHPYRLRQPVSLTQDPPTKESAAPGSKGSAR